MEGGGNEFLLLTLLIPPLQDVEIAAWREREREREKESKKRGTYQGSSLGREVARSLIRIRVGRENLKLPPATTIQASKRTHAQV